MLRVENISAKSGSRWAAGALVRVRNEAAAAKEADVYLLVTHYSVLPSSALSSLRWVHLQAPAGLKWDGIPREWAGYVSTDDQSGTSLMQLTQPAVDMMRAAGVMCRAIGTAADGMSATNECVTRDAAGVLTQTSVKLKIVSVAGEKLAVDKEDAMCGLLVAEDESLLAVTQSGESTHYSLAAIVKQFLADRKCQITEIRCRLFHAMF